MESYGMFLFVSVALTVDLYTPQEYYNVHGGRMGILTVFASGVLHRVGKVITNDTKTFASVLCKELGYELGEKIQGPWLRIYDGDFSVAESWCRDESSILDCS